MSSNIHEMVARLPPPPTDKNTITPLEIINSGTYTGEELLQIIEELIIQGWTYRRICNEYKISLMGLSRWLSDPLQFPRIRTAMLMKADYHADCQLSVLTELLSNNPSKEMIMLATKVSEAHRWAARTGNVAKYGEKLDVTSEGQQIVQVSLGSGIKPVETIDYIDITPE